MTTTILIGISGSGKSTFSNDFLKAAPNTVRVNRDDLRRALRVDLKDYYKGNFGVYEKAINSLEDSLLNHCLTNNINLLVDNTNLKMSYINKWLVRGDVQLMVFDTSFQECVKRVKQRDGLIGEELNYIYRQHEQLEILKKELSTMNFPDKLIKHNLNSLTVKFF